MRGMNQQCTKGRDKGRVLCLFIPDHWHQPTELRFSRAPSLPFSQRPPRPCSTTTSQSPTLALYPLTLFKLNLFDIMKFIGLLSAASSLLVISAEAAVHGLHAGHGDLARRISGDVDLNRRGVDNSKWSFYNTETGNA